MKIAIRSDASLEIGTGHIMRCLALANTLQKEGAEVTFYCRSHTGHLIESILYEGFDVISMTLSENPTFSGYGQWLGNSEEKDAQEFLTLVKGNTDAVVVDHYGISNIWENNVKKKINKLIVIDDLANRKHSADILIDQNIWPNQHHRYEHLLTKDCQQLLGPEFALLRDSFRTLRQENADKTDSIIVFFGGTDPTNECQKVIKALTKFQTLPFDVIIITGQNKIINKEILPPLPQTVKIRENLPEFEKYLAKARYAIGASGISNWERFCLDVNTSLVSVAENQEVLAEYLGDLQAVKYLGKSEQLSADDYYQEFERIIRLWPNIENKSPIAVDGLGTERVVKEVMKL